MLNVAPLAGLGRPFHSSPITRQFILHSRSLPQLPAAKHPLCEVPITRLAGQSGQLAPLV